jgi:nitrate reductase NapE component
MWLWFLVCAAAVAIGLQWLSRNPGWRGKAVLAGLILGVMAAPLADILQGFALQNTITSILVYGFTICLYPVLAVAIVCGVAWLADSDGASARRP